MHATIDANETTPSVTTDDATHVFICECHLIPYKHMHITKYPKYLVKQYMYNALVCPFTQSQHAPYCI